MFCEGVVNLLRPIRTLQAPNRIFYEDFGSRISFIRTKRGLTLEKLGGGKPTTAKSWESGSLPRPDDWEQIAERLGLSVSLIFLGQPKSQADYDFVAKFADEIGAAPAKAMIVGETKASHGSDDTASEIRQHLESLIALASGQPARLGWILEQLRRHLSTPSHWHEDIEATIARIEEEGRRLGHSVPPTENPTIKRLQQEAAKAAHQKVARELKEKSQHREEQRGTSA